MSTAAHDLEQMLKEHRELQVENEVLKENNNALELALDVARKTTAALKRRCGLLEGQTDVLDGVDEAFLWRNRSTLQFKEDMTGQRRLVVSRRGRKNRVVTGPPGTPLLKKTMEAISGRTRDTEAQQEQAPSGETTDD